MAMPNVIFSLTPTAPRRCSSSGREKIGADDDVILRTGAVAFAGPQHPVAQIVTVANTVATVTIALSPDQRWAAVPL